jgi:prepilin-type N-terminal cleavage/methylation domain-containing protein
MITLFSSNQKRRKGFSLVELLTAVSIVGIIAFMAIPKVGKVQKEATKNLAISRAEALNMAVATMVQINGLQQAKTLWNSAAGNNSKYTLVAPYLGYAESTLDQFMPSGFSVTFSPTLAPLTKATLTEGSTPIYY